MCRSLCQSSSGQLFLSRPMRTTETHPCSCLRLCVNETTRTDAERWEMEAVVVLAGAEVDMHINIRLLLHTLLRP